MNPKFRVVSDLSADRVEMFKDMRARQREQPPLANGGGGGQDSGMDLDKRLTRMEGSYDSLKVVRPMTIAVCSVLLAALVFVLSAMTLQMNGISTRMESLAARVEEGFRTLRTDMAAEARATRAEMAAQTSAIANSITATKQAAPQILLVPAPAIQAPPADK